MNADGCVFCTVVADPSRAAVVAEWSDTIAIFPRLNEKTGMRGCTDGHILVIPKDHVRDFTDNVLVTGITMMRAADLAQELDGQWNLITSAGPDATQTVFHLHVHLVPRRPGDGLLLPWSPR
jgi:histidine triad (HIT) family protein